MKIVKEGEVTKERFLKAFLADTQQEAEEVYSNFSNLLNLVSNSYYKSTGIEKGDLFGEALFGLARAKRDFDPERNTNFKTFAIFKIKDALNEYVRKNINIVIVPSYLRKAKANIDKLTNCLRSHDVPEELFDTILLHGVDKREERPYLISCNKYIQNLNNAADRAGITYEELINRAQIITVDILYEDKVHTYEEDKYAIDVLSYMLTDVETEVLESFLEGKTFREIGDEHDKTPAWAHKLFKKVKEKIKNNYV